MPKATYETTLSELGDEYDVDVIVTYGWVPFTPAVREGPMAGPAEGGVDEIISVVRVDSGEVLILPGAMEEKLREEISERCDPEGDLEDEKADYAYEDYRDKEFDYYD